MYIAEETFRKIPQMTRNQKTTKKEIETKLEACCSIYKTGWEFSSSCVLITRISFYFRESFVSFFQSKKGIVEKLSNISMFGGLVEYDDANSRLYICTVHT